MLAVILAVCEKMNLNPTPQNLPGLLTWLVSGTDWGSWSANGYLSPHVPSVPGGPSVPRVQGVLGFLGFLGSRV